MLITITELQLITITESKQEIITFFSTLSPLTN